jgi:ElaB/YqjD/DUF883 family membrane-anchored ribosome-binding protein
LLTPVRLPIASALVGRESGLGHYAAPTHQPYHSKEKIMLESNIKLVNNDVKVLIKDAQSLFQAASAVAGEKAEELRARGMRTLDIALDKAGQLRTSAFVAGKQAAASTNDYVKENPWRAAVVAGGIGLLVGVLIGRE